MRQDITQVWIDEDAEDNPVTLNILPKLKGVEVLYQNQFEEELRRLNIKRDPIAAGKKILRLMKHKGAFVKPCPGTPQYLCCGLQILHIGQGCPMDCTYCALQVYFNRPVMEIVRQS